MRTFVAAMLTVVAVAALLASPASARKRYYGGFYGAYRFHGPYTPNIRQPRYGRSYDFQGGGGNK